MIISPHIMEEKERPRRSVPRPADRFNANRLLQPLREVGTAQKSQDWDIDEILAAIREANRLGIAPETLATAC